MESDRIRAGAYRLHFGDLPGIVRADNNICDKSLLERQYFENPAGDALIELAADKKIGVLAGQYVVNPAQFRAFDGEVNCVLSLNALTHEAYRRQKV